VILHSVQLAGACLFRFYGGHNNLRACFPIGILNNTVTIMISNNVMIN
jgi:hypothetical protein